MTEACEGDDSIQNFLLQRTPRGTNSITCSLVNRDIFPTRECFRGRGEVYFHSGSGKINVGHRTCYLERYIDGW